MPKTFLIGCDPEFGILNGNENIYSENFLSFDDRMGADGGGVVAELRPKPSKDIKVLVKNIKDLLQQGCDNDISHFEWKAGNWAGGEPIGGHIHLGIKGLIPKPVEETLVETITSQNTTVGTTDIVLDDYNEDDEFYIENSTSYKDLIRCLDWYLSCPVALIDLRDEAISRIRARYGNLGDTRYPKHGIEYRALGSWLSSPKIAKAILALTKVITYEYLNHDLKVPNINFYSYQTDFLNRNHNKLRVIYKEVAPRIKKCALYPEYAKDIKVIEQLIKTHGNWFSFGKDMRFNWNLKIKPLVQTPIERIWVGAA